MIHSLATLMWSGAVCLASYWGVADCTPTLGLGPGILGYFLSQLGTHIPHVLPTWDASSSALTLPGPWSTPSGNGATGQT